MWNSFYWRVGMQQVLRNVSISYWYVWGHSWVIVDEVDESAICSSVKESKLDCISYCNKEQVILYMDGWKDLLSSVSLFGMVLLHSLDDYSRESWHRSIRPDEGWYIIDNVIISVVSTVLTLSHIVVVEFDLWLIRSTLHVLGFMTYSWNFHFENVWGNKTFDNLNVANIVFLLTIYSV